MVCQNTLDLFRVANIIVAELYLSSNLFRVANSIVAELYLSSNLFRGASGIVTFGGIFFRVASGIVAYFRVATSMVVLGSQMVEKFLGSHPV